jgi:hypothetical protein
MPHAQPRFFALRYRDPRTGKWIRAPHRCELHELQQRYAEREIIGEPETRNVDPDARCCNPLLAATRCSLQRRARIAL